MTDQQLTRLRLVESELLLLRRQLEELQVRLYEVHGVVVEMLQTELAQPLSQPMR